MDVVVRVVVAGILLSAGADKLGRPKDIVQMLAGLGLGPVGSRVGRWLVPLSEMTAGVAMIFGGGHLAAAFSWGLGTVFAAVGVWALLTSRQVRCACLGTTTSAPLGWRQLAVLPVWVVAGGLIAPSPAPSLESASTMLFGASTLPVILRLASAASGWAEARGDRVAAREAFTWLS